MPKKEAPLQYLEQFIPKEACPMALQYILQYKVHLTITRQRKTVLGDYRHATLSKTHRISVNGDLNKYSFLITLIHELAHLVTFIQFGNKVQSHGREWKKTYAALLKSFIELNIFPRDILHALQQSMANLPASSCADEDLMRILKRYDKTQNGLIMVEQLKDGNLFEIDKGKIFKKGKKLRKRYQCIELNTGKVYLFSPVYEVRAV
jgi:hypothetical protein